uniref:AAA+ ATPase domain-containing protein n=1 Tax=Arcella intermedia TaxID=1963864 RepID=A0A6B2KYU2_9EUKA
MNSKKTNEEGETPEEDTFPSLWKIAAGLAAFVLIVVIASRERAKEISYLTFQNELLAYGFVDHLEVINQNKVRVFIKLAPKSEYYFNIDSVSQFEAQLHESLLNLGVAEDFVPVRYRNQTEVGKEVIRMLPTVVTIGFLIYFFRSVFSRASKASQGGGPGGIFSMGKSKARLASQSKIKVSFKDVAGCEEAKQEISEFVNFLKDPARYTVLGAKIPKGALLVGPPGTGKTLLAKATAGEASVPFYSVSGSDFIEIYGGVGPARVRDLFAQARRNSPCIIFVDEIDAIGRKRGGTGRNDERENTLNQLLVEMDGFESNKGIVVLAGTNRPDILDKALMRPGRFDRQISIDLPDIKSREAIFKVHLSALKLNPEKTIEEYATMFAALTPGFSGADIANVCNEAALIAARYDKTSVGLQDFDAAVDRVIAGLEKKTKVLSPKEKEIVAYHEAGHALVGWLLPNTDPVLKVTIIPRGKAALGFAQQLPVERYLHSYEYIQEKITVLLSGRAAEDAKFGELSAGAQDDLEKVTDIAYAQIVRYGMNTKFGSLAFSERNSQGYFGKPYSETTAELVDAEVSHFVENCYERARNIVQQNFSKLEEVAQLLLKKEVLHGEDLKNILGEKVQEDKDKFVITKQPSEPSTPAAPSEPPATPPQAPSDPATPPTTPPTPPPGPSEPQNPIDQLL